MSPPLLSAFILGGTLVLFASERVRHDLVALIALIASLAAGLVSPKEAFTGFSDPAVLAVAAILVVGRAVELSGVAGAIARVTIPARLGFLGRLSALLIVATFLSAFMNNIAALVITMPIASEVARDSRLPPAATLMPLAFATILGGMTTLIGTPANLILSTVREKELGAPFGFFTMTPVGVIVSLVGLAYLIIVGWRLLPIRTSARRESSPPWRVFELAVEHDHAGPVAAILPILRASRSRLLAIHRERVRITGPSLQSGDTLLILSRQNQWSVSSETGLRSLLSTRLAPGTVTARVVVAHGSFLIGLSHEAVRIRSRDALEVVAVGPRGAELRLPLGELRIAAGDQLFIRGPVSQIAGFVASARLLEIDRLDPPPVARRRSIAILAIFACAILSIVAAGLSPALAFLGAAALLAASRLIPTDEIYRSIDWSVIVLLGAMIPVGHSFETSGAADIAAHLIGTTLSGLPLPIVLAALCGLTLLLSIFLNNVATAVIMGPLAIDAAALLGVKADAALLAVLIGTSSDFLTPIGHQNNLLVMGPGGYRFSDYPKMGAVLVLLVVATAAITLSILYG